MGVWDEFKAFLLQGNILQLAIAFVVGAAITALMGSFVSNLITPIIGLLTHGSFASIGFTVYGSTFGVGLFINALITFVLILAVVFFVLVRPYAAYQAREKAKLAAAPPTTRDCPQCLGAVPIKASRCQFCAQPLPAVSA